jgi:DNA-binding LytR/AlgR family response regulator
VTSGEPAGASGWPGGAEPRDFVTGWLFIAVVAAAFWVVNSLSVQVDTPEAEAWEPWIWEGSSALTGLLLVWIPWLAIALAPPPGSDSGRSISWLRFGAVHLGGLLLYSVLHVGGFMLLRHAVYGLLDETYGYDVIGPRFIYELRKDALSYASFAAVFWLTTRLRKSRETVIRPVSFDIRDGARIIRASVADIVAVSSAGNYVEFWLADGRRPLMRATLAAIEVELEPYGFVRAHRSWLVNSAAVTGLRPDGSGDWTVELGSVEAPVSRRYPQALERLKAPD